MGRFDSIEKLKNDRIPYIRGNVFSFWDDSKNRGCCTIFLDTIGYLGLTPDGKIFVEINTIHGHKEMFLNILYHDVSDVYFALVEALSYLKIKNSLEL